MIRNLIPLVVLLAGCPTPPESGAGGGGAGGPGGGGGVPPVAGGGGAGTVDEGAKGGTFTVQKVDDVPGQPVENGMSSAESQTLVKDGPHITLSGEILCTSCKGKLVFNVTPFQDPENSDTKAPEKQMVFQPVVLDGAGAFNVAVPKHKGKLVIEVLDDQDGNGRPSPGEPFAVLHEHGKIGGRKSHTGLTVDFSQTPPPPPTGAPPEGPEGKAEGKAGKGKKGKKGKKGGKRK
jgi:hypothetical protein